MGITSEDLAKLKELAEKATQGECHIMKSGCGQQKMAFTIGNFAIMGIVCLWLLPIPPQSLP